MTITRHVVLRNIVPFNEFSILSKKARNENDKRKEKAKKGEDQKKRIFNYQTMKEFHMVV